MFDRNANPSTEAKRDALRRRLLGKIRKPFLAPLSFSQERLWFLDRLVTERALFCETKAVRVAADVDRGMLQEALTEVVGRHEALRTTFVSIEGRPLQCISATATIDFPFVDLVELEKGQRDATARSLAESFSTRPYDLERGPLVRLAVFKLDDSDHLVVVSAHHIIADGWSVALMTREILGLCLSRVSGRGPTLPDLHFHYSDFARWQRDSLQGPALERQVSYWREQLKGLSRFDLPADRPRSPNRTWRGATVRFELPSELLRALRQRSHDLGSTLFVSLVACFQALLARYSGAEDIAVGTPVAGRTRPETEKLIGCFVNMLVLRTDLSGDPTFGELVERVREVCLGALTHQDLPFEKLVDELRPPRQLDRDPFFDTVVALMPDFIEIADVSGVREFPLDVDHGTAKYDLTLLFLEGSRTLKGHLQYSTELFDEATVTRAIDHLRVMLEAAAADPGKRLWELPLLTEAEHQRLVLDAERTVSEYPARATIHELFAEQVTRAPDAIALVCDGACVSYGELSRRAGALARRLLSHEVGPGAAVGLLAARSFDLVEGMLGILEAGGAYLPLDADLPTERLRFMLEDASAGVVLAQAALLDRLPGTGVRVVLLDEIAPETDSLPTACAVPASDPSALAYINYTSGSAGIPKGVAVPHRAVARLLFGVDYAEFGPAETFLHLSSPSFDATTFELWGALLHGGRCVLYSERVPTAAQMTRTIDLHDVTTVWLTASLYNALIDEGCTGLGRLGQLLIGGEALSVDHVRRGLEMLDGTRMVNGYGPTEGTTFTCCFRIPTRLDPETTSIPIGRPIGNTRVYVLDRGLNPTPTHLPGEVFVGGSGLARGYLARPALTAERFVPDRFGTELGGRLYRTGDLARWNSRAELEYLGRLDNQIKLRGHRIELGEVESALLNHASVRQAAAAVRGARLVGYVVPASTGTEQEMVPSIRRHVAERLPEYMVPSSIVVLDELPLTSSGKLDRRRLPAPDGSRPVQDTVYLAPRDELEEELAGLWTKVLGVERVGVHDNFFELGGHSLLATQLVSRLRESFEVELPLRKLFEQPTVAGLAEAIRETRRGPAAPSIQPIGRDGELPLSFAQQRLLFLDRLTPGSPFYNVSTAVRLSGKVEFGVLERTMNEIVRRHETLRTTFATRNGRWEPVIARGVSLTVPVVDLTEVKEAEREEELQRLAGMEARRGFDLERGPLIRVVVLSLGGDEHAVLLTMHHIVSDGWSMGVLVREVGELYGAYSRGEPSPLPELRIQYADFASWQRGWLTGAVLEEQLAYWRNQLSGVKALALPTDRPRRVAERFRGARFAVSVGPEVTSGLERLSRSEDVTLFMTMLAAFQTLLYRYTGQDDVAVGSAIANRNRAEIEGLIGFFVNTLVMRTDLSGGPSFRNLLSRVKEVALGAYGHQDLPFERLVEELQPERDTSLQPLVQVMFVLQNAPLVEMSSSNAIRFHLIEPDNETAKFDLEVHVWEQGGSLQAVFMYNTDLFDEATIRRMSRRYQALLTAVATNPDERLPDLTLDERLELPPIRRSTSNGGEKALVSGKAAVRPAG